MTHAKKDSQTDKNYVKYFSQQGYRFILVVRKLEIALMGCAIAHSITGMSTPH